MISDCSPLLSYCSISVNVSPASVLTCQVYSIVPSEVPFAINIAFPLDLTETSAGLESIVAADADSRKSKVPFPSRSAGVPYEYNPAPEEVTRPLELTIIIGIPTLPSLFSSVVIPASFTSLHPSSSESKSNLLGTPSPSVSNVSPPSTISVIPSLSSSKSSSSGILSLSVSFLYTLSCASFVVTSWSHLYAGVDM